MSSWTLQASAECRAPSMSTTAHSVFLVFSLRAICNFLSMIYPVSYDSHHIVSSFSTCHGRQCAHASSVPRSLRILPLPHHPPSSIPLPSLLRRPQDYIPLSVSVSPWISFAIAIALATYKVQPSRFKLDPFLLALNLYVLFPSYLPLTTALESWAIFACMFLTYIIHILRILSIQH